ncbi:hypothetical protein PVK06_011342 [Gossypium arboreum]|uniref:Uncharacterized protein n=1 Tax=Gossypium arboreum TaxID=29729 RepID=A0ABR0Q8N1_GOSAR|nr:hypothetical protein PVK06_011342 [Gossypium arboreum]
MPRRSPLDSGLWLRNLSNQIDGRKKLVRRMRAHTLLVLEIGSERSYSCSMQENPEANEDEEDITILRMPQSYIEQEAYPSVEDTDETSF